MIDNQKDPEFTNHVSEKVVEKIAVVLPCFNEADALPETYSRLCSVAEEMKRQGVAVSFVFVDDGSSDDTWQCIERFVKSDAAVSGIKLSRNVGHQRCLWAGLTETVDKFDAMITIDADLQDDERTMVDMVRKYKEGCDIVYGVRKKRKTDSFFKRWSAKLFYNLMRKADSDILNDHADYRLMSSRAVKALLDYPERNLFLRGMVRKIGFREGFVYYDRKSRTKGESKYPLSKMLSLSFDGITSFSVAPLHFITFVGIVMTIVAFFAIAWAVYEYFDDHTIEGWTSTLVSLWFIGGVVTTALGVIGTYIGKIYTEVKRRPHYFVERFLNL